MNKIILGGLLAFTLTLPGSTASGGSNPYQNALIWPLPDFPTLIITEPSLSLDTPTHSSEYASNLSDMEDRIEEWTSPITDISDTVDDWIGVGGILPDSSAGADIETDLDPLSEIGTAYDFVDEMGTNIALVFEYAKALLALTQSPMSALIPMILIVIVWFTLVNIIVVGAQFVDMIWALGHNILDRILQGLDVLIPG